MGKESKSTKTKSYKVTKLQSKEKRKVISITADLFRYLEQNAKGYETPGQTISRLLNFNALSPGQ